jgi:XTP/dITP diphosphohydrolase
MGLKNILFVVTRNQAKLREIKDLLQGEGYLIHSFADFPHIPPLDEAGETLEDNARKKALEGAKLTGEVALADDSSLEIEALGGGPGIYSARFLGEEATDDDRNRKILELMMGYRSEERKAKFRCVIAISNPDRVLHLAEGECRGLIAEHPKGMGGFGYDPIFYFPPYGKTLAEMEPELKNRISHRGIAMRRAKEILREMTKRKSFGTGEGCAAD